jgi:hypothetical protein
MTKREREERALDAILVSVLRMPDPDFVHPELLPELTAEEKAAMDDLGPDFIDRCFAEADRRARERK